MSKEAFLKRKEHGTEKNSDKKRILLFFHNPVHDVMSEKTKAKIRNIVFSRFIITAVLLMLQIWILFLFYGWLKEYIQVGMAFATGLGIILIIYMVNSANASTYKLAWVLIFAIFPVFGTLLFLYIRTNIGHIRPRKILGEILDETKPYSVTEISTQSLIEKEDDRFINLKRYIEKVGGYPAWTDTKVEYYPFGEEAYEPLLEAIRGAKKFIFLEFFIVEPGKFWNNILDALEKKVKEGVEVRMLYDDFGCIATLPRNYYNVLRKKGINSRAYAEMLPVLSTHYNNRDHRKILVVDNKVGFTGGINLADEYINEVSRFGKWKDCMVRLEGKGVNSLTLMFLQMWNSVYVQYRSPEMYQKYLELPENGIGENEVRGICDNKGIGDNGKISDNNKISDNKEVGDKIEIREDGNEIRAVEAAEYSPDKRADEQVKKVQDIVQKVMPEPEVVEGTENKEAGDNPETALDVVPENEAGAALDVVPEDKQEIALEIKPEEDSGYVIPYGDGPYRTENVAENVYMDIISHATKYVYIMTPYLMLSDEMTHCICYAAKSGVDVRLLLPHIPDKKMIFAITRSHYRELMAAGVRIYEFTPGFVHSKVVLADDKIGVVGTINFDFRSLFLHYECGCLIYKNKELGKIKDDFLDAFSQSQQMDRETYKKISAFQRLCGWVLNLLAPLL